MGTMLRATKYVILSLLVMVGYTFWSDLANATILEVLIKEKAVVESDKVSLGDIATFHPATDPRVGRLACIKIAPSPPPGKGVCLKHTFLIYRLGAFMANEKDIKVKVPQTLFIRRKAQVVTEIQLKRIFTEHVKKYAPWPFNRIRIEKISVPKRVLLPSGKLRWTVRAQGRTHWVGPVSLTVSFWVKGRVVKKVPMSGSLLVMQQFLKARNDLKRGIIVRPDDLVVVEKLTDSFNDMYLTDPREAIGKQLLRTVRGGQLLTRAMVRDVPWVRKGQQIRILAENEHIKVTTTGRALEDGCAGEQVKVVNISSGKELFATVKGPGIVVVQF